MQRDMKFSFPNFIDQVWHTRNNIFNYIALWRGPFNHPINLFVWTLLYHHDTYILGKMSIIWPTSTSVDRLAMTTVRIATCWGLVEWVLTTSQDFVNNTHMVFLDKKFPAQQQSPYDLHLSSCLETYFLIFPCWMQDDGIAGHIRGRTTAWLGPLSPLSFYHSIIDNANVPFSVASVASAVVPIVMPSSTDFSFQNLVFWNLFEFSAAEIT